MEILIEREPVMFLRVPITGLRKPIVGIRKPITTQPLEKLQWDELYETFDKYIKYAASKVAFTGTNTSINSAEDLYQEGLIMLYTCYEKYTYKPKDEFSYIFKKSLWRTLRNVAYKAEFTYVDLDTAYDIGYDDTSLSDMYEEYRLKQVVELLGDNQVALNILKEMINPSDRTVWESDMDIARKETLKQQGFSLNVPRVVDVKGTFIQRALKITNKMYQQNLKVLQRCVYEVYSQDTSIASYYPPMENITDSNDEISMEECKEIVGKIKDLLTA